MSEVEETLERVKLQSGVEGYVIVDKDGQVLRRLPSMPAAKAEVYAEFMTVLATKARGVVRLGRPDSVRPELLQYCPDAASGRGQMSAQEAHDAKSRATLGADAWTPSTIGSFCFDGRGGFSCNSS